MSLHNPGGREYTQHVKWDLGETSTSGVRFEVCVSYILCIGNEASGGCSGGGTLHPGSGSRLHYKVW